MPIRWSSSIDGATFRARRETLLEGLAQAGLEPGAHAAAAVRFEPARGAAGSAEGRLLGESGRPAPARRGTIRLLRRIGASPFPASLTGPWGRPGRRLRRPARLPDPRAAARRRPARIHLQPPVPAPARQSLPLADTEHRPAQRPGGSAPPGIDRHDADRAGE